MLPFKQSTKGASPKVVVKESKQAVAFKNATNQDVYIDRWAEASQTQGTHLTSFTRIKQPGDWLEKDTSAENKDKLVKSDGTLLPQNTFQPKGNYLTTHQSLANYHTKREALNIFLGKTAKAADSDKLDGKESTAFLLKTLLSDLPGDSRAGRVASSKALKAVNDKIPSWATHHQDFLQVICGGRIDSTGRRKDYWGKGRVGTYPFSSSKLPGKGKYKIKHNFGNKYYGLVASGSVNSTDTDGYAMYVSMIERNSNDCTVLINNDSSANGDDAAFSFILFNLTYVNLSTSTNVLKTTLLTWKSS